MTLAVIYRGSATRIPELDGLRGIAVGIVLVWHFVGAMMDPSLGAWTKAIYHTTILGRTGVDLFFVLSGFLITGIILDRKLGDVLLATAALLLTLFWSSISLRWLEKPLTRLGRQWRY